MSVNVYNFFRNLPGSFPPLIQSALSTKVAHEGEVGALRKKGVIPDQVPLYHKLPFGLKFNHEDKEWHVQVWNDFNRTCIRMSNEDTICAWLYDRHKNFAIIGHCEMISSPLEKTATKLPEVDGYQSSAAYPMHNSRFMDVITNGTCTGQGASEQVSHEVREYAAKWFKENEIPEFLLPNSQPPVVDHSSFDYMLETVDDKPFLMFFKCIGILAAAYLVYRIVAPAFYRASRPVPTPPPILDVATPG